MRGSPWAAEVGRLLAILAAALVVGLLIGYPTVAVLAGALGYVARVLLQLYRLESWLRVGKKSYPPPARGLWRELYHQIYRIHLRARKRKRKLANALKRFRESAAAFPDAAVILNAQDGIEWFNAGAARWLGLRMPDDLGQRVGNLVRHPAFLAFLARPEEDGPVEFPSPEAEDVVLSASLIRYGKDQRLLLARDVSNLARQEEVRRAFVANVSHELRTPLPVITGYLETLLDAADEVPSAWGRSLQAMSEQAARMGRLVQDLLLLARLESTDEPAVADVPVSAPALIAAVEEEARVRSAGKHRIESSVEPGLWLTGESEQLRSVFNNLVENALQYTPEGGEITLRWHRDDNGGAHFEVRDTGIGVAPQDIERLTERFFRADVGRSRARGGTGLGLAIVKHVLGRHGASLRIESTPGEGSTFTCDFPPERVLLRPAVELTSPGYD